MSKFNQIGIFGRMSLLEVQIELIERLDQIELIHLTDVRIYANWCTWGIVFARGPN